MCESEILKSNEFTKCLILKIGNLLIKMSEHGAALQKFNQELVKCLEELKVRKNDIQSVIEKERESKVMLENNIKLLQDKLIHLNTNLNKHTKLYENYAQTIKDTESGFRKILESSETLLSLAQHEATKLDNSLNQSVNCS